MVSVDSTALHVLEERAHSLLVFVGGFMVPLLAQQDPTGGYRNEMTLLGGLEPWNFMAFHNFME